MIDREKYKIAPDVTVQYAMKDPNGTMRSVVDTPGVSKVEKFTGPDNMGWTKTSVPGKPAVTKHDYADELRGNLIDPNTTIEYGIKNGTNINNYVDTPKGTTITTGIQNSNPGGGDLFGVRQAMKNFGMTDTDIGWNNGTVTYGGQNFMTPTVNDNGTTKATAKEIIDAMNNYYTTSGQKNQIDSVAKTVAGMGLSHAVEYGENGVVTIGGMPLKNVNIMNGVAYAPYSEIVNAVNSFKKQNDYYNLFGRNSNIFNAISFIRNSIAHDNFEFVDNAHKVNYSDKDRTLSETIGESAVKLLVVDSQKQILCNLKSQHSNESIASLAEKFTEIFDFFFGGKYKLEDIVNVISETEKEQNEKE